MRTVTVCLKTGINDTCVVILMEERVSLFYKLHNNKWFHKMNHTLEVIKMTDHSEKALLIKFGACFFDVYNKSTELKQGRIKKI